MAGGHKEERAEVGHAGYQTPGQEGSAKKAEGACQELMLDEPIGNRKQKKEK